MGTGKTAGSHCSCASKSNWGSGNGQKWVLSECIFKVEELTPETGCRVEGPAYSTEDQGQRQGSQTVHVI